MRRELANVQLSGRGCLRRWDWRMRGGIDYFKPVESKERSNGDAAA
jgi:hypothetical protein